MYSHHDQYQLGILSMARILLIVKSIQGVSVVP